MIRIAPVTSKVTKKCPVTYGVTKPIADPVTANLACPVCGHKVRVHPTAAAKQKAYRERKKATQ